MNVLRIALAVLSFGVAIILGACREDTSSVYTAIVGDFRVQALSPTLVRVEPRGPLGFENRTTFMVFNRDFQGIAITSHKQFASGTLIETHHYSVLVRGQHVDPLKPTCTQPFFSTASKGGVHTYAFRDKQFQAVASRSECCDVCEKDSGCMAWVYEASRFESRKNGTCWPLASLDGTKPYPGRDFGYASRAHYLRPDFAVIQNGSVIYDSSLDTNFAAHLLHWPTPLQKKSYALIDRPRFFVPAWGPTKIPVGAHVDKALQATNGYDFRNMVDGDTYVFLLGNSLKEWQDARAEFIQLAGPTPILPDYAYGIWMTRWADYTESRVKEEIDRFDRDGLPLDVRGLDMDWRNNTGDRSQFYNYPSDKFGANLSNGEWFNYLHSKRLHSYLSDHPYPVAARGAGGLQTSPEEVRFRWAGLRKWMAKGSTFWWYDGNWAFSIPPPLINSTSAKDCLDTLSGYAWGSHVYYKSVEAFQHAEYNETYASYQRPIALSKFAVMDWRSGLDSTGSATSPAQHRFPVWWTGDWVDLYGSVESMVDSGMHGFMPFVHSDCGGDHKPQSAADLVRWYSHCAFGPIMRIHDAGSDVDVGRPCVGTHCGSHLPWSYGAEVETIIRAYLQVRCRLAPSLIAGGQRASRTGFPLVARGDFYWPQYAPLSTSNTQYVFLDDMLIAPLNLTCWERAAPDCGQTASGQANITRREAWIPPGIWEHAWDGSLVQGPKVVMISAHFDRMPMWFRRSGGLLILCDEPALRINDQNWSSLTLEAFPGVEPFTTKRSVYERGTAARTDITFASIGTRVCLNISESSDVMPRAWVVRLHLLPGQLITRASAQGKPLIVNHIFPDESKKDFFPLTGQGSAPAPKAGPVAEIKLASSVVARQLNAQLAMETLV